MKKFFKNKKILTIFVTVIVVLSLLTISLRFRNRRESPLFLQKVANDTTSIVIRAVDWPISLISGGTTSVKNLVNAQQENDHLKGQIQNLGQVKARNAVLEAENQQLKSALKLKQTLTDYDIISGSVISRSPDSWSDLLIIDQGSLSGIKKNMPVLSGKGLIGRVIEVDSTSSKVELITSTNKSANRFAIEAKSTNKKMVHGVTSVLGNNQLIFSQAVDGKKLKKDTAIYTSGMGGRTPKGLLVGYVKKTTKDTFGLSDIVEISPAGNLNDPSVVTVVKRRLAD